MLRCHGIPETSVLSIRAGSTRRQVNLSSLDKPLKFPGGPEQCATFKVDVLDLLGSSRLAYDPSESEYCLTLDPADENNARVMEVAFSIRREGEARKSGYLSDEGWPLTEDERTTDERRELSARDYMEKHGLTNFMQFLMQSLMKDKPADPYAFLQKQVTKRLVTEISKQSHAKAEEEDGGAAFLAKSLAPAVSCEELAALASQASATSGQLREDNRRLRDMTAQLKRRYWQLLEEGAPVVSTAAPTPAIPLQSVEGHGAIGLAPLLEVCPDESPQAAAYREIASEQEEVVRMARENSALVEELAQMRAKIDQVRDDVAALEREGGSGASLPT